jgi:hypothetical protein
MSVIGWPVALIVGLIISASTKLHAVIFGQPVAIPVLWLLAIITLLAFIALILYLVRLILQDRPVPDRYPVYVITSLR